MLDSVVVGIPAGIVVVALVEGIKRLFRVEGDRAILVALGVGVVIAVGAHLAQVSPGFGEWWETVLAGVLLGLSACGLFDASQAVKALLQ